MIYVAAYCRVSTDKGDQANSFESQKRYFEQEINRNPDWELYEVYADEGLSGTSTEKRKAFQKMLDDARIGKFSLILTKEVSRFARNTMDAIMYIRELRRLGIGVQFILDRINTLEDDYEFKMTQNASWAQEESRKTSVRVKWGQLRQMERGVVFGCSMLGYDVKDGKMYINESGAEIVRLIYHKFVREHKGTCTIARELREEGYKTLKGNSTWSNTTILKILRNEKYCGDLLQKKTFTPDYLTHKKKYNNGEEEKPFISNHHEPIVDREMWDEAQYILDKNRPSEEVRTQHTNRYPLSGKIKCGHCGSSFSAKYKRKNGPTPYKGWHCNTHSTQGKKHIDKAGNEVGCDLNCQISEKDFMAILAQVMACVDVDKDKITNELCDILAVVLKQNLEFEDDTEKITQKLDEHRKRSDMLLDLYLGGDLTKEEYRTRKEEYAKNIKALEKRLRELEKKKGTTYDLQAAVQDIRAHIKSVFDGVKQDENFYKYILDKIVVNSREDMEVYLNLLPFRWKIVAKSALSGNFNLGTSKNTMYLHRSGYL
ncbi:MAG: recombinase family protein [Oscillospiraceae bacterium]|nr:recombinase family protein [Oscillospiraceae bacterium]